MKLLAHLTDDEFAYTETTHIRDCARGVVLNSQNEICLIKLLGDDKFGHRDYYELPGGGRVEGENLEDTLKRELKEEVGAVVSSITPIGLVEDYYNLIGRENHNYYFLCYLESFVAPHREEKEKAIFEKIVWVKFDEAIKLYESMNKEKISRLVRNRELPILKIAQGMI